MDYFTRLHFCDLDWRLYTRFSSGTTTKTTTKSDEPLATSDNNVSDDDDRDTTGIWKLCLNNYEHSVKFEATVHAKSDQTVQDLKAYLNEIFNSRNTVVYEFYSSSKTAAASSSSHSQLVGSEQFSSLVEKLTICQPSTDFKLQFNRVEFNEREEASVERTIYMMKSGSDKNEINELKQQMEADSTKTSRLEQKIEQLEQQVREDAQRRKTDEQKIATLEGLVNELKLFKDEITAKQQEKQQRIGILKQNSSIVANNDDYMEHLVKWMGEVGYKLHSRLFRASVNGWTASNFHQYCDNKGATLTIVKASSGRIFGGFTVNPWQSSNGSYVSTNGDKAWLFSLNSTTGPIRLNCINHSYVQYNELSQGPRFGGGHDFCMYLIPITSLQFHIVFQQYCIAIVLSICHPSDNTDTTTIVLFSDGRCISTQHTRCCRSLNPF